MHYPLIVATIKDMHWNIFSKNWSDPILFVTILSISFWFSFWLMARTFGYDPVNHYIKIDAKLWSDFGAHIPLIRSFSMGDNLTRFLSGRPVELPGFPGEPIRYHFGFYMLAGILERLGVRLDYALNIPSALGLAGLMIMIYVLARYLFGSIWVGVLSIIFFLFNGSLGFIKFFTLHPLSENSLMEIYKNHRFPVFGPWDGQSISAFWTLNIYTNQRHLAFSFALALMLIFLAIQPKTFWNRRSSIVVTIAIFIIMCILLITNQAVALIAIVFLFWLFMVNSGIRLPLIISAMFSLPWFLFLKTITAPGYKIERSIGYLVNSPVTMVKFISYWWQNLGLHSILIIIGFIISPKRVKILFIIPLLIIFTAPNIWRFSPDMINNHKFFNFFLIIGNMFGAYVIVRLIRIIWQIRLIWLKIGLLIFPLTLVFFLIFSGIIDFFAIYNKEPGEIHDIAANPIALWIENNTPVSKIFLNSTSFYHPANLAGRPIYYGYAYFTWSYGYNTSAREQIQRDMFNPPNINSACKLLYQQNIGYIELSDPHDSNLEIINWDLWNGLNPVYRSDDGNLRIYSVNNICGPDEWKIGK